MPKQVTSLRVVAVAAIAAALLSLPMLSVAQAQQGANTAMYPKKHAARMHHLKQRESEIPPKIYSAAPNPPGCTWPYRNMAPPCMSTWPAGDPNYHGSRPGPTFDEPWEPR
jgi:hypothetical protein